LRKSNPPSAETHFIYYAIAKLRHNPTRLRNAGCQMPVKKGNPPFSFQYPEASIPAEAGFYEWAYLKT